MRTYTHEIFDSRNTSFASTIEAESFVKAVIKAKKLSHKKHIVRHNNEMAEIQNGEVVAATSEDLFYLDQCYPTYI